MTAVNYSFLFMPEIFTPFCVFASVCGGLFRPIVILPASKTYILYIR